MKRTAKYKIHTFLQRNIYQYKLHMNNTYIQLLSMAVFQTVLTLNNGAFLPLLHYNRGSEE
jgi:hypothetical protein